jgi:hypothetical protein
MKRIKKQRRRQSPEVISLDDLTPRKNPKGGAGESKMVFGERPIPNGSEKGKAEDDASGLPSPSSKTTRR